jgi:DNA polymerase IV
MIAPSIIHLDLDAFYASAEELDNPELKGTKIIVGGNRERGVVCACSYATRPFGVRSGMPVQKALRLCPEALILPVRMARYRELSDQVFSVFFEYTSLVEPLSIDEAFLDISASMALFGDALTIARKIKKDVRKKTGLTLSAGIAPNKLLAKLASDYGKPDGLYLLTPEMVDDFLIPMPVSHLWGVGSKTQDKLEELGVKTVRELRGLELETLVRLFGENAGNHLHDMARGKDDRKVEPQGEAKSVGREQTFATDKRDLEGLERELLKLADQVGSRLRNKSLKGRTVTLKVKYADFRSTTRCRTLSAATCHAPEIYQAARELFRSLDNRGEAIRLLGVTVSSFGDAEKKQLFLFEDGKSNCRHRLDESLDRIRGKYGANSILPGSLLEEEGDI